MFIITGIGALYDGIMLYVVCCYLMFVFCLLLVHINTCSTAVLTKV